jgi:hypothetical protein
MVSVVEQSLRLVEEMIDKFRNLSDHSQCTQRRLKAAVVQFRSLSGSGKTILNNATFFRMYVLLLPSSFSISLQRSRDISSDEMLAKVHKASPTAYMLE